MPLIAWTCPSDKPTAGQINDAAYCILECEHQCLAPNLIAALTHGEKKNIHKGKYISATSLTGCVRKLYNERTVDFADTMANRMYGYRGTVIHQVAEEAASFPIYEGKTLTDFGFITELKLLIGFCFRHGAFTLPKSITVDKPESWDTVECKQCKFERRHAFVFDFQNEVIVLGGMMDHGAPLWKKFDKVAGILPYILWDIKTMGDYPLVKFITGDKENTWHKHVKDEYIIQANIYKYLAEFSRPPKHLQKMGVNKIKFELGNIQAFSMNHFPRTGQPYTYKKMGRNQPEITYDIPSIEFMPTETITEFIKGAAWPIYQSLILHNNNGPVCPPESNSKGLHSWRCGMCPFYQTEDCPDPSLEWKEYEKKTA